MKWVALFAMYVAVIFAIGTMLAGIPEDESDDE